MITRRHTRRLAQLGLLAAWMIFLFAGIRLFPSVKLFFGLAATVGIVSAVLLLGQTAALVLYVGTAIWGLWMLPPWQGLLYVTLLGPYPIFKAWLERRWHLPWMQYYAMKLVFFALSYGLGYHWWLVKWIQRRSVVHLAGPWMGLVAFLVAGLVLDLFISWVAPRIEQWLQRAQRFSR